MKTGLLIGSCAIFTSWVMLLVAEPGLGILASIPTWMLLHECRIAHKECGQ